MADVLTFDPLEGESREPEIGTKQRGVSKEAHEIQLIPAGVLALDVEAYVDDFNAHVIGAYERGIGSAELPADVGVARSLIPAGTAALRDFSYLSPEIPEFIAAKCVGCMTCVTECPDTAILGKAIPASRLEADLERIADAEDREFLASHWTKTRKYFDVPARKGREGAMFGIFVDPTKCKGCAECVEVCADLGYHALRMARKDEGTLGRYHFYRAIMDANSFPGPAVVIAYATCQPEHGVGDDRASAQARLAVDSRAFPLFVYDPRQGEPIAERLSLQGNPAPTEDWDRHPTTGVPVDFVAFARTQGRFRRQLDAQADPSPALLATQADRLANWRRLQELARR